MILNDISSLKGPLPSVNNLVELDKIDRLIKDSEIRLKSIELSVAKTEHEIGILKPLQEQLEQNLAFLKSSNAVPIAHEFRKVKQELIKTKARLSMILLDRCKAAEAVEEVKRAIDEMRRKYRELATANLNNVLIGKFGRNGN